MRKMKRVGMMMLLVLLVFTACKKADEFSVNTIDGIYLGTLSLSSGQKSASVQADVTATAVVTKTSAGEIEVHCYGGEFDSTFMLNYFENHDSVMVCLNGSDFEHTYGHMMGHGHMAGGMMNDLQKGETEWQHHMYDEHKMGDTHFGGFDMNTNNFSYTFKMTDGYSHFNGHKK